ncbi:MAG: hypothetical protein IJU93_09545, partial [Lachnospiraceae bacterium]|nr:hypothetical protein [Lachnospiraceae bacterium]
KALKELQESLEPEGSSESANDLRILNVINNVNDGKGIRWNLNERWALTADEEGSTISKALNDSDKNRSRVMTGIKDRGAAPELEDFITTTAEEYPANQYMLVLWDHGGGPKGGFGGDDRGNKENTYITAEQLTSSLSSACAGIRRSERYYNKDFKKFAFIGFDACLMGNLETAMALVPYAEYLIASEDLEPGTGWDHRGYVKELYYPSWCQQLIDAGYSGSMGYPSANSACADDIKDTVKDIGCQLVLDNTAYYNEQEIKSTMSVVSLNETGLSNLNAEIKGLADALKAQLTEGSKFNRNAYLKILEAAGKAVNFNDSGEGIVDLYSLCQSLAGKFGSGDVKTHADNVAEILKPDGHDDSAANNHDPIIMQQYTDSYYFAHKNDGFKQLGGLSVFLPYRNNRFTYEEDDTTETFDGLKDYLAIYKKVNSPSMTLSGGYADLLKAFCAAQAIGIVLSDQYNNEPSEISAAMKTVQAALESDYAPLDEDTRAMLGSMTQENGEIIKGRISTNDCYMKSTVQDKELRYLLALDDEKQVMVKNIRQQLVLSGNNGKTFRLGFLPAVSSVPVEKDGKYQYFTDNQKDRKWFFMGDHPAAVFNIRNLDDPSQQDYFDPFGKTAILAQFPAVMEKKGGNYSQGVVIEAEFGETSMNGVVPKGYYTYDTDTKQLNGFVPWDAGALEDYSFWPQSDLGEYFEGAVNDFNAEDNAANVYTGAISARELTFSRDKEFAKGLEDNGEIAKGAFDYILMDIFGGRYWLASPDGGEAVEVRLYLRSKDGKPEDGNIEYISRNCSDIEPVLTMITNSGEYTLSFDEADKPAVGYYDDDGDFHELSTGEDFANLPGGTYKIVFRDYNQKAERLIVDEAAKVIIDGVTEKVSASNYVFFFYGSFPVLTVGDTDSGLDISYGALAGDGDFPYGIYKTLDSEKPENDLWDFITVKNGGSALTDLQYVHLFLYARNKTYEVNFYSEDTKAALEAF